MTPEQVKEACAQICYAEAELCRKMRHYEYADVASALGAKIRDLDLSQYTAPQYIERRIAGLEQALQTLVDKYIANQGTEHEFVSCITPKGIPDYWRKAIDATMKGGKGEQD